MSSGSAFPVTFMLATIVKYIILTEIMASLNCAEGYRHSFGFEGGKATLESGPQELFGNGGGPFLITILWNNGTKTQKLTQLHPSAIAIERGTVTRIWGYLHSSSTEGALTTIDLVNGLPERQITINSDGNGSDFGNSIYAVVFSVDRVLKLEKILDYKTPERADGAEWGK